MLLLDSVVQACDRMYSSFGDKCGCINGVCNHPSGNCGGGCYECLYHIHYPSKAPENSKKTYDCPKMLYHYVCQYSYLYTTELLCAFSNEWDFIKSFPYYHILSLGCGGCADLMAIDYLYQNSYIQNRVSYYGIDINNLWAPIHQEIEKYCKSSDIGFKTTYSDVFACFKDRGIVDTNIIVISYLLSSLYNRNQIGGINRLADDLAKNVVLKKKDGVPLLLIINDVNSYKRGRDYFSHFEDAIRNCGLTVQKSEYKYFDTGKLYDGQKLGTPYNYSNVAITVPNNIQRKYHTSSINSTVQLLVEVS